MEEKEYTKEIMLLKKKAVIDQAFIQRAVRESAIVKSLTIDEWKVFQDFFTLLLNKRSTWLCGLAYVVLRHIIKIICHEYGEKTKTLILEKQYSIQERWEEDGKFRYRAITKFVSDEFRVLFKKYSKN